MTAIKWHVGYRHPVSAEQAVLGMEFLQQTVHRSSLPAAVGLVMRGGANRPTRAWLTASPQTEGGIDILTRLVRACVPWLGIEAGCAPIPDIAPTVGVTFLVHPEETSSRTSPTRSMLWRLLATSRGGWQLTMASGPVDDVGQLVDLSLSLIGSGDEVLVAAPLLEADALHHESIGLRPRFVDGCELDELKGLALQGRAPSAGIVPAEVAARLLAFPARTEGGWQVLDARSRREDWVVDDDEWIAQLWDEADYGDFLPPDAEESEPG